MRNQFHIDLVRNPFVTPKCRFPCQESCCNIPKSSLRSFLQILDLVLEISAQNCIEMNYHLDDGMTPPKNTIHRVLQPPLLTKTVKAQLFSTARNTNKLTEKVKAKTRPEYSPQKLTLKPYFGSLNRSLSTLKHCKFACIASCRRPVASIHNG